MSTVNLQGAPNMTYQSQGQDVRADQTGLIVGIEPVSQMFRDLLNAGCTVSPTMAAGDTAGRPATPRLYQTYRDVDLGAVIVFDGVAWRTLGAEV